MDRSTEGAGPSEVSPFSDVGVYPAANFRSHLTEEKIEEFHSKYQVERKVWYFFTPRKRDRIWHNPEVPPLFGGSVATGISEMAFKCGFRLPMLPILKKLLRQVGIAIGQLDPNSFFHINAFQARCLAKRMTPRTTLFWHHYELRRNSKSNGFYTIARRTGRADWAQTNSNNRGAHEKWVFISGPKMEKYGRWQDLDPSRLQYPEMLEADKHDYRLLCELDMSRVPLSDSRDNNWLVALWGSGNIYPYFFPIRMLLLLYFLFQFPMF